MGPRNAMLDRVKVYTMDWVRMPVISVSLPDDSLETLDAVMASLELKNRSEAVRASIRIADSMLRDGAAAEGPVEGVLVITHRDHGDPWLSMLQHRYERYIKTQLHSHLINRSCLDVMIVSADGAVLSDMIRDVHSSGKADYVKFVKG